MVKQFYKDSDSEDDSYGAPVIDDDEEIDEDTAFTADDYIKYGDIGSKRKVRKCDHIYDHDQLIKCFHCRELKKKRILQMKMKEI